jgi:hypothetical protein
MLLACLLTYLLTCSQLCFHSPSLVRFLSFHLPTQPQQLSELALLFIFFLFIYHLMWIRFLARTVNFGVTYKTFMLESLADQTNPIAIVFGGLPGYLFFSTYILLVLFWYVSYLMNVTNFLVKFSLIQFWFFL